MGGARSRKQRLFSISLSDRFDVLRSHGRAGPPLPRLGWEAGKGGLTGESLRLYLPVPFRDPVLVLQVRFLEQQNKVLETKWCLLQQLGVSDRPPGLESFFEDYLAQLRKRLEELQRQRGALDAELKSCQDQEQEQKAK